MGQKLTTVTGVRSENFTQPGNAINEIWAGNTEIISRLPFGDDDMAQAGWPENGMPKIPWHNFIIPMKRDLQTSVNFNRSIDCISHQLIDYIITRELLWQEPTLFFAVLFLYSLAHVALLMSWWIRHRVPRYNPSTAYDAHDLRYRTYCLRFAVMFFLFGGLSGCLYILGWSYACQVYHFTTLDWRIYNLFSLISLALYGWEGALTVHILRMDVNKIQCDARQEKDEVLVKEPFVRPCCKCKSKNESPKRLRSSI
ncbi:hypothetical protein BJX99DRAFT_239294 [Aspergillus californicus]